MKPAISIRIINVARLAVATMDHVASLMISAAILLKNYKNIKKCRFVVLMSDGGYGHTVTEVDMARRLFDDAVVIFSSEVGRHNWRQATIWADVKLIHIVKSIRYHSIEQSENVKRFIVSILKLCFGKKIVASLSDFKSDQSAHFVIVDACLGDILIHKVSEISGVISQPECVPKSNEYLAYWFKSIELFPRRQPVLPAEVQSRLWQRLELSLGINTRLVTIYLREKGRGTDGEFRCGGEYSDYVASVRYLNEKGYTILIVGDRPLSNCPPVIRDLLWDAARLQIEPQLFSIFAATESKAYICDPG